MPRGKGALVKKWSDGEGKGGGTRREKGGRKWRGRRQK